jgi:hypothetical protein
MMEEQLRVVPWLVPRRPIKLDQRSASDHRAVSEISATMREKTRATTKAALRHTVGASYLEPWSPEN